MDRTHLLLTDLMKHHTTLSSLSGVQDLGTMFPVNGVGVPKVFKDVALNKTKNTSHKELVRQVKVREALDCFQEGLKSFRKIIKAAGGELPREHWAQRISLGFSKHTSEPFLALDIDKVRPVGVHGIPKIVALIDAHKNLMSKVPSIFTTWVTQNAPSRLTPWQPTAPKTLTAACARF